MKTFRFKDDVCRQLFDRELENWIRLADHPNLVRAIEADPEHELLILEFVYGPPLRDIAERSPIDPRFFRQWAIEIAEGLRFLHEDNEFVHRDIRPANVLIDIEHDFRAKISDMGLGKPFDPDAASHTTIGTFNYMAPELYEGKTDYRSDIFGFGASLYFLLTGRLAVPRSTKGKLCITPARQRIPETPVEIDELIARCMARDPEDRPGSMREVVDELRQLEEWPAKTIPYDLCGKHSYLFSRESSRAACPFCAYEDNDRRCVEQLKDAMRS